MSRRLQIGLAFAGDPTDPNAWSGAIDGLRQGLERVGVEVVPLSAALQPRQRSLALGLFSLARVRFPWRGGLAAEVRRNRNAALVSRGMADLRGLALRRSLRAAGRLDGVIQVGTEFVMPANLRLLTYEDRTVAQAAASPYAFAHRLPPAVLGAWRERQQRTYDRATACCMMTSWAARSVVEDYGIPAHKVHVVGVGRNFSPPRRPRDWSRPRYLLVASEWERKNGPGVLRAFARLRHDVPDATLDVVGRHPPIGQDGVTEHGRLPLGDREGRRRLESLYQSATCFLMPSFHEPGGTACLDAGYAGLPCVGTTEGGSADLIGPAGRLVDPGGDEALYGAMLELSDPDSAASLGELARQRAPLFSWSAVAGRFVRALAPPGIDVKPYAEFL